MKAKEFVFGGCSWKRLLCLLLMAYALLILMAGCFSYQLIFPYRGSSYNASLQGFEMLRTPGGTEIATRFTRSPDDRYLALYFHGNAEDIGHLSGNTADLFSRGISIFALDYPGYGLSEGTPTEASCQEAALTLYQAALEKGYRPDQILLWGRSVGGGIATELAGHIDYHTLVLESPFATAFTTLTRVPIVPFDKFDNLTKTKSLTRPLFILHGETDSIIAPSHSEKLFIAHLGKKQRHLIKNAGHNDLWNHDTTDTMDALIDFLE